MPLRISKSGSTIATFKILNFDSDAQTFLTAAGITNSTQQNAINKLTIDLKYYGLWTKMKALYPVVGGTAAAHKWNLKDPRDLDAAFRLTFSNGWTHSSNGMTPSNAYANTFLAPSTILTLNNTHNSVYIRTNVDELGYDIGASKTTGTAGYFMNAVRYLNNLYSDQYNTTTGRIITSNTDSRGLFISTRTSSNVFKVFKNNTQLGTTQTGASGAISGITNTIYIGSLNEDSSQVYPSTKQYAFISIGDGLTDQDAINFYNIVQRYQINLGRQV